MVDIIKTTELSQPSKDTPADRKVYIPPAILYELELETRAGSPLAPEGIDPLGLTGPLTAP